MRRRPLGKTGLEVSELSLGSWGLSGDAYGAVAADQVDAVIDRALQLGVNLFETADVYGDGAMERKLGERAPEDAVIVTKIGTDLEGNPQRKRFDRDYLDAALAASKERLSRDPDVALLHNPSSQALREGSGTAFLAEAKKAGRVKAWGVSVGDAEAGNAALDAGAEVIALTYNAFASGTLNELTPRLQEDKAGVLAHSVLAYGLLCGHWARDRAFPPGDHRSQRWSPDELRRRISQLDALRSVVGGPVVSLRSAALRFVLSNELVSSAILGPRTTFQLDQLVREAGREAPYLDDERRIKLETRLHDVGVAV
jgi:aryl-alcohol dehydrogenase-like predicted oxidoreductase